MNRIVWLTGRSGAGKTTLARRLQKEWNCVILDGDEMRDSISFEEGFSRDDRRKHNIRVARLARTLSRQANVVVSVIAPMSDVRNMITAICDPIWVYLQRLELPEKEGHFYEIPDNCHTIDCDELEVRDSLLSLMDHLDLLTKPKYSLFIGRWQPLHDGHKALFDKVRGEHKNILIGIRDTEIDESNPLTAGERIEMIKEQVPDAEIVVIPDVSEVVHGRGVGWDVREIKLDAETEMISATDIRREGRLNQ